MPVARFQAQPGSFCQMAIHDNRITSLVPQELGFTLPFESSFVVTEPGGALVWDISYLYAELWSTKEHGPVLIAPSLPEFATDADRPTSLRFPLTPRAVSIIEALRQGGDVELVLLIQATLVGTAHIDRIKDQGRRHSLEALGYDQEVVGPIRRSQEITVRVSRKDWEEKVLPQWDPSHPMASSIPILQGLAAGNANLDIAALARTLRGASPETTFEDIVEQFRGPTLGM